MTYGDFRDPKEPIILSGDVKSHTTHNPLEAVMIKDVESGLIVFSKNSGEFRLPIKKSEGLIVLQYPGYISDTIVYSNSMLRKGNTTIYLKKDISHIPKLVIGDTLPEEFWEIICNVVQHPSNRSEISLKEFKKQSILVFDFWSVSCAPCIRSIDYLDSLQQSTSGSFALLPVYVGNSKNASKVMINRNWSCFSFVGEKTNALNAYFFKEEQYGGLVIVRDGVLVAVPDYKQITNGVLSMLTSREINSLPISKNFVKLIHTNEE